MKLLMLGEMVHSLLSNVKIQTIVLTLKNILPDAKAGIHIPQPFTADCFLNIPKRWEGVFETELISLWSFFPV